MTILLDTSIVISGDTGDWGPVDDESSVISAITVGELAYGTNIGDAAQREHRSERLRRVVRTFEVIPFGVEEAKFYGLLADVVRAAGRNPRPRRFDLKIAATAAAARIPLLTSNPDDFAGLGVWVEVVPV